MIEEWRVVELELEPGSDQKVKEQRDIGELMLRTDECEDPVQVNFRLISQGYLLPGEQVSVSPVEHDGFIYITQNGEPLFTLVRNV